MRVPESYTGLYLKKVLQTAEMQRLSPSYS